MKIGEPVPEFVAPPYPKGIVLDGRMVTLEPLRASAHAEDLFAANALDPDGVSWTYMPNGPFNDLAAYRDWMVSAEDGQDPCFFAIINKRLGKPVGMASYLRIAPEVGTIEVGFIHFSPLLQATPEATEAMFLMMSWAFDSGYRRYEWKCDSLNRKSRRAAQRLGFSYEGIFRQATMYKGRNRDTAWFAVIDKEWPELRRCFEQYLSHESCVSGGRPDLSLSELTGPLLFKRDTGDGLC